MRKGYVRNGLAAFIVMTLLGMFLSIAAFQPSYAQAPAAAPAEQAAAPADAAPPACNGSSTPKILENCTPNSGDTAWMLTSVALVLLMTVPGLGLFYGGRGG